MAADRRLLAAAFAAIAFLTAGPARAAVARPAQTAPAAGATVQFLPSFAWTAVAGADKYEFQISADAGMNSPVLGTGNDDFFTRNTRATLKQTIPNGTYWWRVRATNAAGEVSQWTQPRSFRKLWNLRPALQTPASGSALSFPNNPVVLKWAGVPGAAHYLVSVASDPSLGSLVLHYANQDDPKGPPNVAATSAAITSALAPGPYYWNVVPVDAEGNRGVATPVASFSWLWNSVTAAHMADLNPAPEAFDPRFSWNPVPGAARYEVEINSSVDFAFGSKVCCSGSTIATSLSPTQVLKDNVYYWRVRALDPDGNAGVWNYGGSFTKTFDKVAPAGPVPGTSIKNLRMRDNLVDPGTDIDGGTAGYQTEVPVVRWDPVPGAASYEVQVADWTGSACLWGTADYLKNTAVPEWTPLASTSADPAPWQGTIAEDVLPIITPGTYCFRVRARADRAPGNQEVWGDYTYLQNGSTDSKDPVGPAFTWTDYPDPTNPGASTPCASGYPCSGDYLAPVTGTTSVRTPLFTWKPLAGANSYFVVVAKDANFSNIIDEAFTRIPAYAPRNQLKPTTYPDETTTFYWLVLPATMANGNDVLTISLSAANGSFQKQSTPPSLVSPVGVQAFLDQPTFRWTPTLGARRYRLQVSADPTFGSPLDNVVTDATSYSSDTTYPADTVLYWRVRADDENLTGLTWSAIGTFQKKLATPVPSAANAAKSDALPVWAWSPVQGAASYDISIDKPDGTHADFSGFRTPVASFIKMTGTGVFHWRVRAEFPKDTTGTVPGPYSATQSFTRTIGEPVNARTDSDKNHVLLSWDPRLGVQQYKVQISSTPDFSRVVESVGTENPSYAPTMTSYGYQSGGTLYWRVAGVDEDRNQGDWTQVQQIRLQPRLRLSLLGGARRKFKSRVTARVLNGQGRPVAGVRVRVRGVGVRSVARRTNTKGQVVFALKPRRRGKLVFSATKAGYQPAYRSLSVR